MLLFFFYLLQKPFHAHFVYAILIAIELGNISFLIAGIETNQKSGWIKNCRIPKLKSQTFSQWTYLKALPCPHYSMNAVQVKCIVPVGLLCWFFFPCTWHLCSSFTGLNPYCYWEITQAVWSLTIASVDFFSMLLFFFQTGMTPPRWCPPQGNTLLTSDSGSCMGSILSSTNPATI